MSDVFREVVRGLSHVPGVRGALVVDVAAGVPVVEELTPEVSATALAALTGELFRRTAQASAAGGFGGMQTIHLEADAGQVLIAGAGELLVVALLSDDAQTGRVWVETRRAAATLLAKAETAP